MYIPVERQVKPFLQLLAHEAESSLAIGGAHTPGPARPPQLIICQVVQPFLLDYPVITLHHMVLSWVVKHGRQGAGSRVLRCAAGSPTL